MVQRPINILLIEDDEDDYVIFKEAVDDIYKLKIELEWVDNYRQALEICMQDSHDIYFVDYRLAGHTGIEFLDYIKSSQIDKPVIILTGQGDYTIDVQAMHLGAQDYLEKDVITPGLLERTIRYGIERSNTMRVLRKSENKLRNLSAKLINAQEDERGRIAKELHDSINSGLAAIKFKIEKNIYNDSKQDLQPTREYFKGLVEDIQSVIQEVRNICTNLRPSILDDFGAIKAIGWLCRKFEETYSDISLTQNIIIEEHEIPETIKTVIYRVLQEALNNITKHSQADKVKICLKKHANSQILLSIEDNGCGFDTESKEFDFMSENGMGLNSMEERVIFSGGQFKVESILNTGTSIIASWDVA